MQLARALAVLAAITSLQVRTTHAQTPVVLTASDSVRVVAYLYEASSDAPRALVIAFHQGGANARGEYRYVAGQLVDSGYTVLAVDARSGGNMFGDTNQTVARLGAERPYCEAALDVEAALAFAARRYPGLPKVLVGSSFSGALVLRATARQPQDVVGVVAFSPATGTPMADGLPESLSAGIRVPALIYRPAQEAELPPVVTQLATFRAQGHEVVVASPGRHGASMLDPARVEGNVEPTWERLLHFLAGVAPH